MRKEKEPKISCTNMNEEINIYEALKKDSALGVFTTDPHPQFDENDMPIETWINIRDGIWFINDSHSYYNCDDDDCDVGTMITPEEAKKELFGIIEDIKKEINILEDRKKKIENFIIKAKDYLPK